MTRLHLVIAALVATSAKPTAYPTAKPYTGPPAPDPQTADQFCTAYEETCKDIGTSFEGRSAGLDWTKSDTAACKAFYEGAAPGIIAEDFGMTELDATRACYQYQLSQAKNPGGGPSCNSQGGTVVSGKCTFCNYNYSPPKCGQTPSPTPNQAAIAKKTYCPNAKGTRTCVPPTPYPTPYPTPNVTKPWTTDEFCTKYEGFCRSKSTTAKRFASFQKSTSCEWFYSQADSGYLETPIDQTADGATRSCYQHHLSIALVQTTTDEINAACENARGEVYPISRSVCIAPKECTAPMVMNPGKTACVNKIVNKIVDDVYNGAPMRATPLAALVATAAATMFALW